jgi:hypothetical protein
VWTILSLKDVYTFLCCFAFTAQFDLEETKQKILGAWNRAWEVKQQQDIAWLGDHSNETEQSTNHKEWNPNYDSGEADNWINDGFLFSPSDTKPSSKVF